MEAMDRLHDIWHGRVVSTEPATLAQLGDLHRALRDALVEVEDALAPKIVDGARQGKTYVELAVAAGYGSTTTISKIMRDQAASPGRGSNQPRARRASRAGCTCGARSRSLWQHEPNCGAHEAA